MSDWLRKANIHKIVIKGKIELYRNIKLKEKNEMMERKERKTEKTWIKVSIDVFNTAYRA